MANYAIACENRQKQSTTTSVHIYAKISRSLNSLKRAEVTQLLFWKKKPS